MIKENSNFQFARLSAGESSVERRATRSVSRSRSPSVGKTPIQAPKKKRSSSASSRSSKGSARSTGSKKKVFF